MAESLSISQFRILDNPETIVHWKYDDIDEYAVFNLHIIEQKHYEYEILIQIQTLILNRQRDLTFYIPDVEFYTRLSINVLQI